ncbi:L-ascorbate metabolism protein UlaG (beta-lactamase superfamily) [Stella humosa]|uniref:L-ascorbate metabolism protein UlaG (Beta-lactamase superfamily) n=1 Tax=Stella humosa TaxID=94 RepID=A0A3N1KPQ4_9PROT|nr:MBL fold metallo-hydrolase [Stella humosa]ROP81282.1 L-ascorbate metabolism protein UlaG (beta-lactamase superfamily) [Stella humosa]BBK32631.1 Zn-dependent hydrolase [Stella humosa]
MRWREWILRLLVLAGLAPAVALPAFASCGVIAGTQPFGPPRWQPVAYRPAAVAPDQVRLTFIGHASFLIETPDGATAITDYNGYNRPANLVPDIITMNNAHSTHYTDDIPPGVRHVLRGWDPGGGMAVHNVQWRDLRVFNVPTNVREYGAGTRQNGNSIFVFSAADLCIAHLSHIHHTLTDTHLRELGPIDVLLAPVDGSWTTSQEDVLTVIGQIKPRLVIPMHFIVSNVLERFLAKAAPQYPARFSNSPEVLLTRTALPRRTEILVLPGH